MSRADMPVNAAIKPAERSMSVEEAVKTLRADPSFEQLLKDSYLFSDVQTEAQRFLASDEFDEVKKLIGGLKGRSVLDLGAGTGVAAWAFSAGGAANVYALEPDPSPNVGRGAIESIAEGTSIHIVASTGEAIPLKDDTVDVVYARQVLHHVDDLERVLRECSRVLKPSGVFIATREHVVDDERELAEFLAAHPIHALAGGENARPLHAYKDAIMSAGLTMRHVLGPLDSVINAYPTVRSTEDLSEFPRKVLGERFGKIGSLVAKAPGIPRLVRNVVAKGIAGRMYSFVATKP